MCEALSMAPTVSRHPEFIEGWHSPLPFDKYRVALNNKNVEKNVLLFFGIPVIIFLEFHSSYYKKYYFRFVMN